jgi:hypothetical protein
LKVKPGADPAAVSTVTSTPLMLLAPELEAADGRGALAAGAASSLCGTADQVPVAAAKSALGHRASGDLAPVI